MTKPTLSTISVDLIGVSDSDKASWLAYPTEKYWTPNDVRRAQADKLSIPSDKLQKEKPYVVQKDNPIWRQWFDHGATDLLIVANLHLPVSDAAADPQKKFLPLGSKYWKAKHETLVIELYDTEIRVITRRSSKR